MLYVEEHASWAGEEELERAREEYFLGVGPSTLGLTLPLVKWPRARH